MVVNGSPTTVHFAVALEAQSHAKNNASLHVRMMKSWQTIIPLIHVAIAENASHFLQLYMLLNKFQKNTNTPPPPRNTYSYSYIKRIDLNQRVKAIIFLLFFSTPVSKAYRISTFSGIVKYVPKSVITQIASVLINCIMWTFAHYLFQQRVLKYM